MNSNRGMHANKQRKGEVKLSVTEKSIPVSVSARKAGASVQHVMSHAAKTKTSPYSKAIVYSVSDAVGVTSGRRKVLVDKLQNKEYRDAYVRATTTHGIAHQIRTNRELRNLTQNALATKCGGKTTQVAISRLEDPAYGKFTLNSILKVASALDVAVLVRFVPYSKFLLETADKSVEGLFSKSFVNENLHIKQALVTFTMPESKQQTQHYVSIGSNQNSTDLRVVTKQPKLSDSSCDYAFIKSN